MKKSEMRQSNFELIKIIAMLMIVAHHFIAKNAFNVDSDIVGLSINKIFLQFIGNHAFIGNNLFFMCSAWFLVEKEIDNSFPKPQFQQIWKMEKPMLFYSITLWIAFRIFFGGGTATLNLLAKSVFPMSTGIWWYPTTYAVFLLIHPFYQKGLCALESTELKKMIFIMFVVWSVSTLVPLFNYGSSNFLCFVTLYAVVFYMKKYGDKILEDKKKCRIVIVGGYTLGALSIMALDILGTRFSSASTYACYFIRGNYRLLPMVISISIFSLAKTWKIKNHLINYVASLTFGIYLVHMYPLMMGLLFGNDSAVFNMSSVIDKGYLPIWAVIGILLCFIGCACIEAIRKCVESIITVIVNKIQRNGDK